jgi:putative MATE family efflux protein
MTQGKPWRVLAKFAAPLILSGIIQQFYNLADQVIVGNFAGADGSMSGQSALAAVGASVVITTLFIMLGGGASMGCNVIISQLFGAKRFGDLKTTLFTSLLFFSGFSILLALVGSVVSAPLLQVLDTPKDIFPAARDYLEIYMYGLPFLFLYNVCNAIFNALGDSKKPLYFLIFSTVMNVFLDYIFVAFFGWAVRGVAWATFIAQGAACLISLAVLLRKARAIDPGVEAVRAFDLKKLASIMRISIPSMLQMSIVSVGALLVQKVANTFGSSFIAGYSPAVRIQQFMSTAINTTGSAVSTYAAQNIGAGRHDRVNGGIKASLVFTVTFSLLMACVVYLFGETMLGWFGDSLDAAALDAGAFYLRVVVLGMAPFCFFNVFNAVARGAGYMPAFTVSTLTDLAVRVAFAYLFVGLLGRHVIAISVVTGWAFGILTSVAFHMTGRWRTAKRI